MTELRAKHQNPANLTWGINGETGVIENADELDIWEPFVVKESTLKTSMEVNVFSSLFEAILF